MTLPTAPTVNTVESMTPDRMRAIVYGPPGAGKTTLASGWFPKTTLLIDMEGGTRFLTGEHFIERPSTYGEFLGLIHSLATEDHGFTTVVIDTIDNLVRIADAEAGQRGGKVAAGLVEFGKGLADRDGTILRELRRLTLATDLGLILTAHPKTRTLVEDGKEVEKTGPRIDPNDRITQEIEGLVDFIFHVGHDHQITTGGVPNVVTKRRVSMPDSLPADAAGLYTAVKQGVDALAPAATPVAA